MRIERHKGYPGRQSAVVSLLSYALRAAHLLLRRYHLRTSLNRHRCHFHYCDAILRDEFYRSCLPLMQTTSSLHKADAATPWTPRFLNINDPKVRGPRSSNKVLVKGIFAKVALIRRTRSAERLLSSARTTRGLHGLFECYLCLAPSTLLYSILRDVES